MLGVQVVIVRALLVLPTSNLEGKSGRSWQATLYTCNATFLPGPGLPVSGDVAHEQDAGIHVEEEDRGTEVAVDQADGDGAAGIVGDADGETEAEQEVSGCQVLQVDHNAAGPPPLSSEEIKLNDEAIEEETHLQRKRREDGDLERFTTLTVTTLS